MIERFKKEEFREKLIKRGFYEGVTFKSEDIEKVISEWIFNLKEYRQIELERFTDILSVCKEIKLPVIMEKHKFLGQTAYLIDAENKQYSIGIRSYCETDYIIDRKENILNRNLYREYVYFIESENKIVLKASYAGPLKENKKENNISTSIKYDTTEQIAIAKMQNKEKILEIKYYAKDSKMDEQVTNYLLSIKEKDYSEDIVPVLKDFIALLGTIENIISIESRVELEGEKRKFSAKEKVCARIYIEDGEAFYCSPRKIEI